MDYLPFVPFFSFFVAVARAGVGFAGWAQEARQQWFLGKLAFVLGVFVFWPLALLPAFMGKNLMLSLVGVAIFAFLVGLIFGVGGFLCLLLSLDGPRQQDVDRLRNIDRAG
jgi:hypothetical protein